MASYIDFDNELVNNWNPEIHELGKPVPADCNIFGLKILDWDNSFSERLETFAEADLRIPFQYITEVPAWSKGANWNAVDDIMGRFEGPAIYSNSSAQEFTIEIIYFAETLDNANNRSGTPWSLENIEIYTKRLQSMVYPGYDGNFATPNKVLFNIGNQWRDTPLIVKNVTVTPMDPIHVQTGLPMQRKIAIDVRTSYPLWQGIGNLSVYAAWDESRGVGDKIGNEIFAYESLDSTWQPGDQTTSPFENSFTNY